MGLHLNPSLCPILGRLERQKRPLCRATLGLIWLNSKQEVSEGQPKAAQHMLWAEMSACKSAQSRPYSRRGRLLLSGHVEGQDDRVGIDFRPFLESTGLPRGEGHALFLWGVGVRGVLKKKNRFETDQI